MSSHRAQDGVQIGSRAQRGSVRTLPAAWDSDGGTSIYPGRIVANSPEDPLHPQHQQAKVNLPGWLLLVLVVALLLDWLFA